MSHIKRISVPDRLYQEAYYLGKKQGLSDEAASWRADLAIDQLLQTPELPHQEESEDE